MLLLSLWCATGNALRFYPRTLLLMFQAGVVVLIALCGLWWPTKRRNCQILSSILLGLLAIPCLLGTFPGGDDGGGLCWMFVVGGGCVVSFCVAIVPLTIGLSSRQG